MNRKGKVQFWLEFFSDLFCLVIANAISYVVFHFIVFKIFDYASSDWLGYFISMLLAFIIIYSGFHSNLDITRRNRKVEAMSAFRNASLTYLTFSAIILLLKNPIIESRYMLLSGYLMYLALLMPERYFLKRWITGFYTKSKTASIVGIITTSDIAEDFIADIKKDWMLNVSGVVLADTVFASSLAPSKAGGTTVMQHGSYPEKAYRHIIR